MFTGGTFTPLRCAQIHVTNVITQKYNTANIESVLNFLINKSLR